MSYTLGMSQWWIDNYTAAELRTFDSGVGVKIVGSF